MFLVYPPNVTYAPLGSTVTLECVADQPSFAWTVSGQQLIHGIVSDVSEGLKAMFGLEVGPTEEVVGGNNRSTLSFDASVATNDTFNSIVCEAGSSTFTLVDGPSVSITVYGEFTVLPSTVYEVGHCVSYTNHFKHFPHSLCIHVLTIALPNTCICHVHVFGSAIVVAPRPNCHVYSLMFTL